MSVRIMIDFINLLNVDIEWVIDETERISRNLVHISCNILTREMLVRLCRTESDFSYK